MIGRIFAAAVLAASLTGCATAQQGALLRAQKAYDKNDFRDCLAHVSRAKEYGEHSDKVNAQLSFNEGLCLEGVGRKAEAMAIYRNLILQYPNSELAARAKARIAS